MLPCARATLKDGQPKVGRRKGEEHFRVRSGLAATSQGSWQTPWGTRQSARHKPSAGAACPTAQDAQRDRPKNDTMQGKSCERAPQRKDAIASWNARTSRPERLAGRGEERFPRSRSFKTHRRASRRSDVRCPPAAKACWPWAGPSSSGPSASASPLKRPSLATCHPQFERPSKNALTSWAGRDHTCGLGKEQMEAYGPSHAVALTADAMLHACPRPGPRKPPSTSWIRCPTSCSAPLGSRTARHGVRSCFEPSTASHP